MANIFCVHIGMSFRVTRELYHLIFYILRCSFVKKMTNINEAVVADIIIAIRVGGEGFLTAPLI